MKYGFRSGVCVCLLLVCMIEFNACRTKNSGVSISQKIISTNGTSSIVGRVTDDKGAPLPGVNVLLESGDGRPQTINTSSDGGFSFQHVPVGEYSVSFSIEGFNEVRQESVQISHSMNVSLEITLRPSLAEEFTVVGETPMIDTKRTGNVEIIRPSDYLWQGSKRKKSKKYTTPSMPSMPAQIQDADELVVVEQTTFDFNESLQKASPPSVETRSVDGKAGIHLPLRQTDVEAEISGFVARTTVVQVYSNSNQEALEAVYSFPLPTRAAIYDFIMEIEGRRILGIVRPKDVAQQIYSQAREQGYTASLLTQERANIFTQNIANIPALGTVTIHISYFERLRQEDGYYEYVFPAVVGERYNPPDSKTQNERQICNQQSKGKKDEQAPPIDVPTGASRNLLNLTVHLNAALPIQDLKSVAHKVNVENISSDRRIIRLTEEKPNRDFVLKWKVASDQNQSTVLTHAANGEGYFSLLIQSPLKPDVNLVVPREITFILDISGSMQGLPLNVSKEVIERTLDHMKQADLFNIVFFSGGNDQLWEGPQPASHENLEIARKFLKDLDGGGATEMLPALRRALSANHDQRYLQMYVFLTDGFVGNEVEILRVIKEEKGDARFFAFGIGSSVNRYLIEGIGSFGSGLSCVVLPKDEEQAEKAAAWFFRSIDAPVLADVQIDWLGLPVEKTYPRNPKDLFAGQTIEIIGKYSGAASGTISISGRSGMEAVVYKVPVIFPAEENTNRSLALLYARQRIDELSESLLSSQNEERDKILNEITELSVKTGLISQVTSFVAVDESRVVSNGRPIKIVQPVEKAEGSFSGNSPETVRIEGWGMILSNKKDGVHINAVEVLSTAAKSGIRGGTKIKRINRTGVYDLEQLELLLLQAGGQVVEVELESGGKYMLPLP